MSQSNTNAIAETALADTPAGDACDTNATTRGLPGVEWNSPINGTCIQVNVNGSSSTSYVLTNSGNCPIVFNTGITMRGNIGNAWGNAANATGYGIPSYCDCPFANTSQSAQCASALGANCVVAQDVQNPYYNVVTAKWITMTQYTTSDVSYNLQYLTHQDPSDWAVTLATWQNNDVTSHWDYIADASRAGHPGANTLTGQLWTFLRPSYFFPGTGETQPAANRPSHYADFQATQHSGYSFTNIPALINRFVPIWVKVIGQGPEVPFILAGTEPGGGVDVISETASGPKFMNGRFDSTARSALAGAAAWNGDVIVADEAVAGDGPLAANAVRAIETWSNDTSIRSGLSQTYQLMTGTSTSNPNTAFAPAARAYSASLGMLYAIRNSSGWRLYAFNVPGALAGAPSSNNVVITGAVPLAPIAMAYNFRDKNLYAIDAIPVGGNTGLRLLRLSPLGVATEVWRTTGDTVLPMPYLSISTTGEIVLGLSRGSSTPNEVILFDTDGHPWWSTTNTGVLLARPVANESGVSIGRTDTAARYAIPTLFVARSSLTHGLCASTWFKGHVDSTVIGPLGYPGGDCP